MGRVYLIGVGTLAAAALPGPAQQPPRTGGPDAPVMVCFSEDADPGAMEAVNALVNAHNQRFAATDYFLNTRWPGTPGEPKHLTWSFVPDGLSINGLAGEPTSPSTLFATLDNAFASQGGRAAWVARIEQAFQRWSQVAGVTFTRVAVGGSDWDDGAVWGSHGHPSLRGDIRISMHPVLSGVVAYTINQPYGDMVMNSSFAGSFAGAANEHRFLRNLVAHELGHAIGLNHVCTASGTALMQPQVTTAVDGPRQDDIRGGQRHYGDPFELNESPSTATPLGELSPVGSLSIGDLPPPVTGTNDANAALLSIDAAGKVDWFGFTVATPLAVTITVAPVGSTYANNPQVGGSCTSGSSVNALTVTDLAVDLYSSTHQLVGANNHGVGVAEAIENFQLPPGTYAIRVREMNAPGQSQLYRLSVATACYTNCDGSTTPPVVNIADFSCFLQKFAGGELYANCDQSTSPPLLNVADFTCFLQRFAQGCP